MRQNHENYKVRVLEKTTDSPGVKSDNTVIAIEFESHIAKICQTVCKQVGEFKRRMKLFPFKTHK